MTRTMVNEVMYDTTSVTIRKSAGRMRSSGGTVKFECVDLVNISAIARTNTGVFVPPKPLDFHSCGRGGVWDLTSHITCLVSQCGQTGNHSQEEFDPCFNNVELRVQVLLPPKIHHDALGFILEHLTPVAHEREEMPHDKQDEWHHRLLRCGIQAQGPLDAVMLNEIEYDISTFSDEHWVGKNVYKWFPANEEADMKMSCSSTVTTYSKLGAIVQQGYQSDVFHVVFATVDEWNMDE